MSSPSTFSASRILRKLGVRTRTVQPEYRTRDMTPVIVLADMSRTYAPEAIEARAITGQRLTPIANRTYINVQMLSRGRGGIVVEHLSIAASVAAWGFVEISTTSLAGAVTGAPLLNIGGEATLTEIEWSADQAVGSPIYVMPAPVTVPTDRLFVPAGQYLHFGSIATGAPAIYDCEIEVVFREIPEALGAP